MTVTTAYTENLTDPLVNDRARWYEPQDGGFTTRDPWFAATDSAYTYADDDPTQKSDPTGLNWAFYNFWQTYYFSWEMGPDVSHNHWFWWITTPAIYWRPPQYLVIQVRTYAVAMLASIYVVGRGLTAFNSYEANRAAYLRIYNFGRLPSVPVCIGVNVYFNYTVGFTPFGLGTVQFIVSDMFEY